MKFDITMYGKKEFYKKNNKTYHILKVVNNSIEEFMNNIIIKFIENQKKNTKEKHYVGIDFEFNKVSKSSKGIALMQMNLENDSNIGYIFVLYPPELKHSNILIKLITMKEIIKILHGAESLDIPYLFDQLLLTKENINNFCHNFYDTKYLCDYNHMDNFIQTNIKALKCSIYNLLLYNNIIDEKKFDELENIENITGPIYNIHIDIHKLDLHVLRYSLYDVLYLPELIKVFLNKNIVYSKIIPEISVVIYKYKRNVENEFNELKSIIDTMNLYFIKENNNTILLKDIYDSYYYILADNNNIIDKIKEIHYFKKFFETILKLIIYNNIIKYFTVYKTNKMIIKYNINTFNIYFNWLNKYNHINTMINEYNNNIINDLKKIIKYKFI